MHVQKSGREGCKVRLRITEPRNHVAIFYELPGTLQVLAWQPRSVFEEQLDDEEDARDELGWRQKR